MAATLINQVKALTGLTISFSDTNPTHDQLNQFFLDGCKELVNRMSIVQPDKLLMFSTTDTQSSGTGIKVDSGLIISAMRADGSVATNLYPAEQISQNSRYKASDVESLEYRSVYNPAFYVLDGYAYILPEPSDSGVNKGLVTYINFDSAIDVANDTSLDNIPEQYHYIVVLYASQKALEAKMAEFAITEEDFELVQIIQANLVQVQTQYDKAFGLMSPPQRQRGREEARRGNQEEGRTQEIEGRGL